MGGIQSGLKKGDEMRGKKEFLKMGTKTSLPTHVSEHENDNVKELFTWEDVQGGANALL